MGNFLFGYTTVIAVEFILFIYFVWEEREND